MHHSLEYVGVRQSVQKLDLIQHRLARFSALVHLQDHHCTRGVVLHLRRKEVRARGGMEEREERMKQAVTKPWFKISHYGQLEL